MGITRFNGPVYGAKSLLFEAKQEAGIVSTVTQTICQMVLPSYQDWFFTEMFVFRASTGSTGLIVALSDDSSRATPSTRGFAQVGVSSSLANSQNRSEIGADAGEYEGARVAAGSTLTFQFIQANSSAAALTSSGVFAWAYGFIRYVDSTRAV